MSELVPHQSDPRLAADIAFLQASVLVLKGLSRCVLDDQDLKKFVQMRS